MNYSWGKIGKNSLAFSLLDNLQDDLPYAELWYGAHPKSPSKISDCTSNLLEILNSQDSNLPFLAKFLSINQALSIQAHPSKEQAAILRLKDPANYPDDNHKPEVAIALSAVSMLHGWMGDNELETIKKEFPEFNALNIKGWDSEAKKSLLQNLFSPGAAEKLNQPITERLQNLNSLSERQRLFLELYGQYGKQDAGIALAMFLRLIKLKPFESIYTPAGQIHAYLKGDLFECMANSDNVIRAGLTPKFIDTAALLEYADFENCTIQVKAAERYPADPSFLSFADNSAEFKVLFKETFSGQFGFSREKSSNELLVINSGSLETDGIKVEKGHGLFIAGNHGPKQFEINGKDLSFFRIFIP